MISKIDMIRDEIEYTQELLTEIKIKRTELLELLFDEIPDELWSKDDATQDDRNTAV